MAKSVVWVWVRSGLSGVTSGLRTEEVSMPLGVTGFDLVSRSCVVLVPAVLALRNILILHQYYRYIYRFWKSKYRDAA